MAFSTYVILPGMLGQPSMPVHAREIIPTEFALVLGPLIARPTKPVQVVNGNGVTLVTGAQAAGARPDNGQQIPRNKQVVLSQFAESFAAGEGQR